MTRAAVLYVFRVMVDDDIPMNAGCLKPIRVILPEGSMLSPALSGRGGRGQRGSVAGGDDTLFAALRALGSAQGTMNNLTFGDATHQYYETICSGAPAGPGFDGAAAVHTHMTNSRLTDPEILESRFPVVLEDFHIRRGSGGKGKWNAGDGTLQAHPVPQNHGRRGAQRPPRPSPIRGRRAASPANSDAIPCAATTAAIEILPGCAQTEVEAGEAIEIVTPTGGGWGAVGPVDDASPTNGV